MAGQNKQQKDNILTDEQLAEVTGGACRPRSVRKKVGAKYAVQERESRVFSFQSTGQGGGNTEYLGKPQ